MGFFTESSLPIIGLQHQQLRLWRKIQESIAQAAELMHDEFAIPIYDHRGRVLKTVSLYGVELERTEDVSVNGLWRSIDIAQASPAFSTARLREGVNKCWRSVDW